jgi:hypothetical protein
MAKVKVTRGRGRPDVMGAAIVGFIRSKPWNGRKIPLGEIVEVYARTRAACGKLSKSADIETKNANIQIQNMLRVGKLVRVERGVYTLPAAVGEAKPKRSHKAKAKVTAVVDAPVVAPNLKAGTEASE